MVKWITFFIGIAVLRKASQNQEANGCSYETLLYDGKQITCFNVSSIFFQYSVINLQRSRWLICKNCNLSQITNDTFNFPKNTINYLVLRKNNVISISNFAFIKFPFLKILNLKSNLLNYLEPKIFVGIRQLLQIDLSENMITRVEDNVFVELENLDILNLNNNKIVLITSEAFKGLTNLKYLYVNHNNLEKIPAAIFQYLCNLKILYLENNKIIDIDPLAFGKLQNLNYLYLNNNAIKYLTQYNFKNLINLVDLQLRFNNLTEINTSTFNGLKKIKYLYLGNNNIKHIQPYGLIGLNSLEILELINNKFETFTLTYLNGMEQLSAFWLDNNGIRNFTVDRQESDIQKSIKILTVEQNNISSFDYELLHQKVPNLKEIWIGDNPWQCDFIIELYDYFKNNNISLCTKIDCNVNSIKSLTEKICFEPFQNETDLISDFVLDNSNRFTFNYYLLLVCFFLLNYYSQYCISTSFRKSIL